LGHHSRSDSGGKLSAYLDLTDEYTKQCLAIEVGRSIRALDAIRVLDGAIKGYGQPEHIRSDNGPEFIAEAIGQWMSTAQIKSLYIQPGSPWEQAYIESFHDKFRDECLNRELFVTLAEARVIIHALSLGRSKLAASRKSRHHPSMCLARRIRKINSF
jgi:transposase InsO family protein